MRVISTAHLGEWHKYINGMPSEVQDIHFLPEMMFPYEVTGRGRGGLLVDEHDTGRMIMPVLQVNDQIHHPYNFGGPVATPEYVGKVSISGPMYCTLSPFLYEKQQPLLSVIEYQKESVWIDLTKAFDFRQTTKHEINKANEKKAEFTQTGGERALNDFAGMYAATMARVNAANHWLFDINWFRSLLANLGPRACLCVVTVNGEPECGCILIHGYGTCYYHFAASHGRIRDCGLNHFMVAKAAELAKELKCKRFHLGGGVQPRDGLFTFKSGFSDLTLPIYKYRPDLLREVLECQPMSTSQLSGKLG
jgi:hypothetical protein